MLQKLMLMSVVWEQCCGSGCVWCLCSVLLLLLLETTGNSTICDATSCQAQGGFFAVVLMSADS